MLLTTQYPLFQPRTFPDFIQNMPSWEAILLEHAILHSGLYTLHHCLQTGQACIGVSDGLVQGKQGAFGWSLSQTNGPRLATGM